MFTLMVMFGVAGEALAARLKFWSPRHVLRRWSEIAVVFGIAGEVICLMVSLRESAQLNKDASAARLEVVKLQTKLQPRRITRDQRDKFLSVLANDTNKSPVWIVCNNPSGESLDLIFDVRTLLDDAGYAVKNPEADFEERPYLHGMSTTVGIYSLVDLRTQENEKNFSVVVAFSSKDSPNNLPARGIALFNAFGKAGINAALGIKGTNSLKKGMVIVIVPNKEGF